MGDELNEDMKEKIRNKYKEIKERNTIEKAASELGVSEGTFHKYKNSDTEIEKTPPENLTKDFDKEFEKDKEDKEDKETDEDEENETYELVF